MALDERHLRELADSLGPEWESLASHLDFRNSEIFRIKQDNHGSVSNQIFNMLLQWKQKLGGSEYEACEIFIDRLKQVDRNDLASKVQDRRERCVQSHQASGDSDIDGHIEVAFNPSPEGSSEQFRKQPVTTSYSVKMPGVQINRMTVSSKDSPVIIGNINNSVLNFGGNRRSDKF